MSSHQRTEAATKTTLPGQRIIAFPVLLESESQALDIGVVSLPVALKRETVSVPQINEQAMVAIRKRNAKRRNRKPTTMLRRKCSSSLSIFSRKSRVKIKYFLYLLTGVSSTILLSANPALAQSQGELTRILINTNLILLIIMGASAAISSFNSSISGAKLVARGNPVSQSLLYPLFTSLLTVLITIVSGLILEQWNFAFTCIVAVNGGIFLVNLFIAVHHFYSSSN